MREYVHRQLILQAVFSKWYLIPSDASADGAVKEDAAGGDAAGSGDPSTGVSGGSCDGSVGGLVFGRVALSWVLEGHVVMDVNSARWGPFFLFVFGLLSGVLFPSDDFRLLFF